MAQLKFYLPLGIYHINGTADNNKNEYIGLFPFIGSCMYSYIGYSMWYNINII